MKSAKLVFTHARHGARLTFGEQEAALAVSTVTVQIVTPEPEMRVMVAPTLLVAVSIAMAEPEMAVTVAYDINVDRPVVGALHSRFQETSQVSVTCTSAWADQQGAVVGREVAIQEAAPIRSARATWWEDATPVRSGVNVRSQEASPVRAPTQTAFQDGTHARCTATSRWQTSIAQRGATVSAWQDCLRRRSAITTVWQEGTLRTAAVSQAVRQGIKQRVALTTAFQEGKVPAPGKWLPTGGSVTPPGRTPDATLIFYKPRSESAQLIFGWIAAQKVIPVRKAYVMLNSVTLKRSDTSVEVAVKSLNIATEFGGWVQSWSAEVAYTEYQALMAGYSGANALELVATVNGHKWALLAEGPPQRSRTFGTTAVKISGRGISAWLDDPYATKVTHFNDSQMTAQQLMAQALTYNNVSLGWAIDWQISDWTVPAGLWSLRGTPIAGVKNVAEAVSAIVQADAYEKILHILPYYPAAPWNWSALTPDIEIPLDIMDSMSEEPVIKPTYNRVYVSGVSQGVNCKVTRSGTDGATEADPITHPLIYSVVPGTQRGLAVLGDTGHQAQVSISMPISDDTGLLQKGQLASVVDTSDSWLGLVRGVSVSAQWDSALKVRQSAILERHFND